MKTNQLFRLSHYNGTPVDTGATHRRRVRSKGRQEMSVRKDIAEQLTVQAEILAEDQALFDHYDGMWDQSGWDDDYDPRDYDCDCDRDEPPEQDYEPWYSYEYDDPWY